MFLIIRKNVLAILSIALLGACAQIDSSELETSGFYAHYDITAEPNSLVSCEADFTAGEGIGATMIELSDGDKVFCSDGTVTKEMKKVAGPVINAINYRATGLKYSSTKTYSIIFQRESTDEKLVAKAKVPVPVKVLGPRNGTTVQVGSMVDVTWTPTAEGEVVIGTNTDNQSSSQNYADSSAGRYSVRVSEPGSDFSIYLNREFSISMPKGLDGMGYSRSLTSTISLSIDE